ncbi:MAG TPA: peptidase domain-containing ABC transporter [Bryobacteraceae bacterium]|jgi:ATP-binding cassette subfamily B protein RaxB|nr:peptidase domain-containing ABC transporter [Bryobacteraceae bacterium]
MMFGNRGLLSKHRLPLIFQTAAAECGLACLAMVANYHGLRIDLATIRQRFCLSLRGMTLAHLLQFAGALGLAGRPLRIELEDLQNLETPSILHWDMEHFVVLRKATKRYIVVHDPALGLRKLKYAAVSRHFTGVALELTPTAEFTARDETRSFGIKQLTGRIAGLKRSLSQVFVLAALLELLVLVSPLFLQLSVDKVIAAHHPSLLVLLGFGFAFVVVVQALLGGLRGWTTLYFGTSLKLQWYTNIFSHLVKLPVSFFEKRYFGDILSRFDGAEAVQRTLTNNFVETLLDGIISAFVLVVMALYSVKLALIVLGAVLLYILVRNVSYGPLRGLSEEQIIRMAKQQSFLIETLRGIRTIKVFGRENRRETLWMNLVVDNTNAQIAAERVGILLKSINTLIFGLQWVAVVWYGAERVLNGEFTVGMLFAFVTYQAQFTTRVSTLVDRLFELRMLSLQIQRLADIALEKPETGARELTQATTQGAAAIEVRSLSFRYSDTDRWLLENVSFSIQPGECVAITGPSGAGKSTLLKLIAGLLAPQQGTVAIGGQSLAEGLAAVPGRVGFVLQDDSLFGGTIADNISFAADEADMSRVEACARMACLHDEIEAMPMRYNTMIGDMGSALSGGQHQRLLLARALYSQPSILILDEATSHLDIATERAIAAMLGELKITRIFAAHRPETIAIASRVIALENAGLVRARTGGSRIATEFTQDAAEELGVFDNPKLGKGEIYANQ